MGMGAGKDKGGPKKFNRHQWDRKIAVKKSWRRPKGIDGRCRRRMGKGLPKLPKIGYGTAKAQRHLLPNGLLKFVVANVKDLELLMMHNVKRAAELNIKLT